MVLISFNSTTECLLVARELKKAGFTPIIVDNSESAKTFQTMGVSIITAGKNLGYSGGFNYGFRFLKKYHKSLAVICVANSDLIINYDRLYHSIQKWNYSGRNRIFGVAQQNENAGLITGVSLDTTSLRLKFIQELKSDMKNEIHAPIGSFMGARTETWEYIQGLSEEYFLYFEELDLAKKIKNTDIRFDILKDLIIIHEFGKTMPSSTFSLYHEFLSREVFCKKWFSNYKWRLISFYLLFIIKNLAIGKFQRANLAIGRLRNCTEL